MKALLLEEQRRLMLREIDDLVPREGETVVAVEITGIGGSEYLGYSKPGIRKLPNIMGHGIAGSTADGRRVAVNPLRSCNQCAYCEQKLYQLCDRWALIGVHVDGGFAQEVVVPDDSLVNLPDSLAWEQAAFIEPFANSVNAWELSGASAESSVAIIGVGSLGLGLITCATADGCTTIDACDLSHERLSVACELGAAQLAQNAPDSYNIVFDTVGTTESRQRALELTCKGGKCVFLGFATQMMSMDIPNLIRRQTQILGSFVYSHKQFLRAVELAGRVDAVNVKNISFEEVEPMLNRYLNGDFSIVKAALRPASTKAHS